jgi:hypothetical protein
VAEDDRDGRIGWPADVGAQQYAVVRDDLHRVATQLAKGLVTGWIRAQSDTAHGHLFGGDNRAG